MQGGSSPARSAAHGCPWSRATGSGGVNPAPCVSVYTAQMEPVVTTRWAPNAVEQTREIEDFDAFGGLYCPKVFRFALPPLSAGDAAKPLAQDFFLKPSRARQ